MKEFSHYKLFFIWRVIVRTWLVLALQKVCSLCVALSSFQFSNFTFSFHTTRKWSFPQSAQGYVLECSTAFLDCLSMFRQYICFCLCLRRGFFLSTSVLDVLQTRSWLLLLGHLLCTNEFSFLCVCHVVQCIPTTTLLLYSWHPIIIIVTIMI